MPRQMKRGLLATAVRRASERPEFMGFLFAVYMKAHAIGPAEMAQQLECDEEGLMRMSLCLRPREGPGRFLDDLRRIATVAGTDPDRLLVIAREAEAIEAVAGATSPPAVMAAREHEEPLDDEGPDSATDRKG